jgi:hypothetical protein
MNTRMYPRSMQQAFPKTAEYATAFHAPQRRRGVGKWLAWSALAFLALFLIAAR